MSLELIREAIKVNQIVGDKSTQTIIENDIIVPDTKPDIARILLMDGDVCADKTEVMQDKIMINGSIRYKILYICDDAENSIKSINVIHSFNCGIDIPNARPGMNCRVKCDIEHMEYEILNGRKVNAKAIVEISARVNEELEHGIVYDMQGLDDIQTKKKSIMVNNFLGSEETVANISELLEVPSSKPSIREILRNDIRITGKDYKVADDKIVAKGELNIATLYVADDETGSICFMEHEVPFTQFINIEGIGENSVCELGFRIADWSFETEEDSDGELRMLKADASVYITADAFEQRDIEIIEDAYSPNMRVELEKEPFTAQEVISDNKGQIVIKDIITLDESEPGISEIFNLISKPVLSQYNVENDKVNIEGFVNNKVLYLSNTPEQPLCCHEEELPLNQAVDVKGISPEMKCDAELEIEQCNFSMLSEKEIEIRLVINVIIRAAKQSTVQVIKKAVESELDNASFESQPSITIYFAQKGDTLWNIAKKYYTTVDELMKINDIEDGNSISIGQQIIIPKKRI